MTHREMALNLLDINNDCLTEIFRNLNLEELANVASTCTRFQTIAQDVFSQNHEANSLEINVNEIEIARRPQTTAILRNFGYFYTKLKVVFGNWRGYCGTSVFNLIMTYCTGPLERMELVNCNNTLQPDKIIDAKALFRNVKELILHDSSDVDGSFLSEAKQLTHLNLKLFKHRHIARFLTNDYPKLESLSLVKMYMDPDVIDIMSFLKRHPNLVEVELLGDGDYNLSSIGEFLCLRKLAIEGCVNNVSPIAHLDKLTSLRLKLTTDEESLIKLLQKSKSSQSLEELVLSKSVCDGEEIVAALRRFTNLKELYLTFDFGAIDDALLSNIHRLKKLRALSIGGHNLSLTSDGLINLVQHLPHLEQLVLHPDGSFKYFHLKCSTYDRMCEICFDRTQKLVIYDFDVRDDEFEGEGRTVPFGEDGHLEGVHVQYITLGTRDDFPFNLNLNKDERFDI